MKLDFLFALETAGWPAFVVDDSGLIRRANQTAVHTFGTILEGESASLSAIWSQENNCSPETFLARLERSATPTFPLKFLVRGGATKVFSVFLCVVSREGKKYAVFQLFDGAQGPKIGGGEEGKSVSSGTVSAGQGEFNRGLKSEALSLDQSLAHKQKLDCALQLTRTVALDFNNALTSILGHTSLVLSKMEPKHPWRDSLLEVEKSAEKAAEIAYDLAAFSRQEKDNRAQIAGNVNDLVRRTIKLFQNSNQSAAQWQIQLENKIFSANFDEAKMQQAFVKILDNAIQAVNGEGGLITVRTQNQVVTEPLTEGTSHLVPGHYVCVEISDNGAGIPEEVLPRIFEPFFTTKNSPHNRGLGLAWVYGIVTNHGGHVIVSSQSGQGTTVRIYLPALKKIVRDAALGEEDLKGDQTILMVDDEDLLLTMGQMILSSFGYSVLTANNGRRALEIFSSMPDQIDLVITDLVMPKMSGRELIEALRRLRPDVKIICSTGYVRSMAPEEEESYLLKPFTSQDLLRKVKEILQPNDAT